MHRGGATGGGGGSGDDGGSGSVLEKAGANWKKIKEEATHKAEHKGIVYYKRKLTIHGKKEDVWISWDTDRRVGSYFKVWIEKGSKICFDSTHDANIRRMENKHPK